MKRLFIVLIFAVLFFVTGVSGQEYTLELSTNSVCDYAWVPVKEDGEIKTVDCRDVVEEDWSSLPPAKDVVLGQTVTGVSGQEYTLELSTNSVCDYAWVPSDFTETFKIETAGTYAYTLKCIGTDPEDIATDALSLQTVQAVNLPWWREIIPYLGGFLRGL